MALGHWLKDYLGPHSGGGDPGYSCKEDKIVIAEKTVTTTVPEPNANYAEVSLLLNEEITASSIFVTFEGVEYVCNVYSDYGNSNYGAPYVEDTDGYDWSNYPFSILSNSHMNMLYTEHAGTYTVKIETVDEVVETTPCFEKAVNSVIGGGSEVDMIKKVSTDDPSIVRLNKTVDELLTFLNSGKSPFVYDETDDSGVTLFNIVGLVKSINFNDRSITYTIHVLDPDHDGSAMDFVGHLRADYPTATIS